MSAKATITLRFLFSALDINFINQASEKKVQKCIFEVYAVAIVNNKLKKISYSNVDISLAVLLIREQKAHSPVEKK